MVPLPSLPLWISGLLALAGMVVLVLNAALFGDPDDSTFEKSVSDVLGYLWPLLFGAAGITGGITGLFRGIQHKKWKKQVAPLARDLAHQISNDLVRHANDAYSVVSPAIPPGFANPFSPDPGWNMTAAFGLAEQGDLTYERLEEAVEAAKNALLEGGLDRDAQEGVVAAATEVIPKMDGRADELEGRVKELAGYRKQSEAAALIEAAIKLAGSTSDLESRVKDGDRVVDIGIAATNVFFDCHGLNRPLRKAYRDVASALGRNLPRSISSEPD